jgi:hypothetical protein
MAKRPSYLRTWPGSKPTGGGFRMMEPMSGPTLWSWLLDLSVLPIYAVWLVGIIVALVRWSRHPQVSAIVAASLVGLLVLNLAMRVGSSMIISAAQSSGQPLASIGVYLGILGVATSLLRAGAWSALLIALFGWRPAAAQSASLPAFQFSIRGLMFLTLAVAVLCGIGRGLIFLLGESAAFLLNLIDDVPLIICWIMGMRVAVRRWNAHPQVSQLAVLGICIQLAVLVLWQVWWITRLTVQDFPPPTYLVSSLLALVSVGGWVMILVATFGWRELVSDALDRPIVAELVPLPSPAVGTHQRPLP